MIDPAQKLMALGVPAALARELVEQFDQSGNRAPLLAVKNLSDLKNVLEARNNLGLGTAATKAAEEFATSSQGSMAETAVQPEQLDDALEDYAPLESPAFTGTVTGITKSMVGLGNVDNTSDVDKPVSTAQAEAIQEVRDDLASTDPGKGAAMVGFSGRSVSLRLRDTVSALDLMGSGGLDQAIRNREATAADAQEITQALAEVFEEAGDRGWAIDVPAGLYYLDDKLTTKPLSIAGGGMGVTELQWVLGASDAGIHVVASTVNRTVSISDIALTSQATTPTQTAIYFDYSSLVSGGVIQPRANTHGKLFRVAIIGADRTINKGWANGVVGVSMLGLDIDSCRINGLHAGAYGDMPLAEKGVHFLGNGSPVQLTVDRTLISAFQDAILTEDAEGVYISSSELVNVGCGYRCNNVVGESGLAILGGHINTVDKSVVIDKMSEAFISNVNFYNVESVENVEHIVVGEGRNVVIEGNVFRRLGTTAEVTGVHLGNATQPVVRGNTFDIALSGNHVGIRIASSTDQPLIYQQDWKRMPSSTLIINESASAQIESLRGFSGDLNSISTDWRMPKQIRYLVAGASNIPPSWPTASGGIVETISSDANTAIQIAFLPNGSLPSYTRRKSGGVWSSWESQTPIYGSNSNGQYSISPDGTLYCWGIVNIESVVNTTVSVEWTYPYPPATPSGVVFSTNVPTSALESIAHSAYALSATKAQINLRRTDMSVMTPVQVMMIGRAW